ncbi:MAG: hypothetical protein LBJ01_05925 [Tannerella sp.]|nr:hypothetical protein [Tannerella sp.]
MKSRHVCALLLTVWGMTSCSGLPPAGRTLETKPPLFPDYVDVTIPYNMAPLHFKLADTCRYEQAYATFEAEDGPAVNVKAKNGQFAVSPAAWKKLMDGRAGRAIRVTVTVRTDGEWVAYAPFRWQVAQEPADPYIVYRLIEPGYEVWNEMGLYQRHLESFRESAIVTNRQTQFNCMNCHSFCMQNPEKMLFHMREKFPCTVLIDGDRMEKLNTKTEQTLSALVYPSWHPSGRYVAFSVNDTKQLFHTADRNRIEVFDLASDVVVYDVEKHEIVTAPELFSPKAFETFPTFSPDGHTLFFCSSDTFGMPGGYAKVKYSLCSIAFDPERRQFGTEVDTLYHAGAHQKSVSFPRVSPDGQFLMFTLAGYGNFSIWHRDADLYLLNLSDGTVRPLDALNSDEVESYHSWSSNSRWVVFSSRRMDGLYTRPYLAYVDAAGVASKPFLLPQEDVDFYPSFMKSFNIPEFVTGKVKTRGFAVGRKVKNDGGIDVTFAGTGRSDRIQK